MLALWSGFMQFAFLVDLPHTLYQRMTCLALDLRIRRVMIEPGTCAAVQSSATQEISGSTALLRKYYHQCHGLLEKNSKENTAHYSFDKTRWIVVSCCAFVHCSQNCATALICVMQKLFFSQKPSKVLRIKPKLKTDCDLLYQLEQGFPTGGTRTPKGYEIKHQGVRRSLGHRAAYISLIEQYISQIFFGGTKNTLTWQRGTSSKKGWEPLN